MIARFFCLVGRHAPLRRVTDKNGLRWLRCDVCGYQVPTLRRTPEELARVQQLGAVKALKAQRRDWLLQWRSRR